jgi:hypothetical protein
MKISLKAKLSSIGIDIKGITESIARDLYVGMANLARLTYNKAVEIASQRLHTTRQDYINALHLEEEAPGIFVVYLDPVMNHVEEGYPPFPMLPKLAQGPKSKVSKDGHRYVVIPLRQHTSPDKPTSGKSVDFAEALKEVVRERKWKKVKEGISPKSGKYTTVERVADQKGMPQHLRGLTRVREYGEKGAKRPISSAYYTFRTASEKQDPATHWYHPGYSGAKVFPDVFSWADSQLDIIVSEIFGK